MEITASEMKRSIEKIYQRLDKVTPVDFDCGKLCDEVCCVYDAEDYRNEELALYLLPGEEELGTNPRSKSAKLRVFERRVMPDDR